MDAPKIPTLKDSQKPQVKVRGLEAGVTLFDRLKQFKKKDLAFILAGLGTLFMAPLAEHFMMAPEQASDLTPGMSGRGGGGGGLFGGNGSSPYEPGATGLASGNPAGGSLSDIITPLNVRDPSALVMGPGATQQPPTQSVAPGAPPPTAPVSRNESDLKDALASSGIRAAGAASKAAKALLPVPKVGLGNNSLRGLGVTSGGTSASGGLAPISAANVSNKASTGGGLSPVKALPGYRGAAGGRGQGQGGSGIEAARAAAEKAGSLMNQGPASAALDQAAAQQIPGGGAGLGGSGQGGTGATDKGGSGNQDKSSKNVGESLEFLKQKAIQEKKIELWAKEQEANDMNLLMAQTRNEAIKSVVGAMAKSLGDCAGKLIVGGACVDPSATPGMYECTGGPSGPGKFKIPSIQVQGCTKDSVSGTGFQFDKLTGSLTRCGGTTASFTGCVLNTAAAGGDPATGDPKNSVTSAGGNAPAGVGGLPMDQVGGIKELGSACKGLQELSTKLDKYVADATEKKVPIPENITTLKDYAAKMYGNAGKLAAKRDILFNGQTTDCGSGNILPDLKTKPVTVTQQDVVVKLTGAVPGTADGVTGKMIAATSAMDASGVPYGDITAAEASLKTSGETLKRIKGASELTLDQGTMTQAPPVTGISQQMPGADAEITALVGNIQKIKAMDGQLGTISNTVTDVQAKLEALLPQVREASGKAAGEGTLGKVVKTNSDFNEKVIQPVQNGDKSLTVKEVAKPDYAAMHAPDAKNPAVGKVADDTSAAVTSVKETGTKVDTYNKADGDTKAKTKDETQTAVNATSDAMSKMRNTQAGVVNDLDGQIRAQGDRLRTSPAAK